MRHFVQYINRHYIFIVEKRVRHDIALFSCIRHHTGHHGVKQPIFFDEPADLDAIRAFLHIVSRIHVLNAAPIFHRHDIVLGSL